MKHFELKFVDMATVRERVKLLSEKVEQIG
jgi:hypothetical protein